MWCHNVLRRNIICNEPAIFTYLQCLTNHKNPNGITLKHPARRLLVSDAREYTIGNVIDQWSHRFESEGIPQPTESIKRIVAHVTGMKKIKDFSNVKNNSLNASQIEKLESLCKCRLSRMPIQYLIGEWDFRDITVKLIPPIFVPWPETEILVDFVLRRLSQLLPETDKSYEVLEIGCGSGVISLALANACKKLNCIAIDTNPNACDLTTINRNKLGLKKKVTVVNATLKPDANIELSSGWNDANVMDLNLNTKLFDFVISNPPYVPRYVHPELQPEIRIHNDFLAFDGGDDGLKVIKLVLRYAAKALKPGGRLFMEVHTTHPEQIQNFTNEYPDLKLQFEHTHKDFCNDGYVVELMKAT